MKLLIDLDILLYKGLFAVDGYYNGLRATDNIIYNILERFDNPEFELVVSGSGNFRKQISADYKANRKPESRPRYLYESKQYYKRYWNAVETVGEEADDYIASNCDGGVIVSTDKDFKQVGAPIFNPTKWELTEIENPHYWWWLQTLIGDASDNIPGLKNPEKLHFKKAPNFTEETASKLLVDKSPEEMKSIVQYLYKTIHGDDWYSHYDTNCRLLFLRRKNAQEYWDIYG
jgi:5'-3' exonuclease